ncbi:MAG: hypothetical protein C0453_15565 [Comamonadaceae bacterium]|nr:hypothetical protein [Comamonadaceae bacterium]
MTAHPEISPRSDPDDPLAITPERLHQYYRTVQSETPAEAEIDAAMARRRERGRANRSRQSGIIRWVAVGALLLVLGGIYLIL